MLNGRMLGNTFGNFTCFNVHGQSVIDYALASDKSLRKILLFNVSPFNPLLFDTHCKISFRLLLSLMMIILNLCLNSMSGRDSFEKCRNCFTDYSISQKLLELNNSCTSSVNLDING